MKRAEKAAEEARDAAMKARDIESELEIDIDNAALAAMELKSNLRQSSHKRVKTAVVKSSIQKKVRKEKWKAYQKEMAEKS